MTHPRRLAQVAKDVGVSESTVSRVLNNKPGMSDATHSAVLTALDVLGYERPTKLRGERARLVGVMLPEAENPIYPAFTEQERAPLSPVIRREPDAVALATRRVAG